MRLDRLLSTQLGISRRDAARAIRRGRVRVDGEPLRDPSAHLDPAAAEVRIDDTPVPFAAELTLVMHKPPGVLSATRDAADRTVLDLVPAGLRRRGLAPVGRLDRDTTGLLLLTTDGTLNHRLCHPRRHVPKTYLAAVAGEGLLATPEEALAQRFEGGLLLGDGTRCRPARFAWAGPGAARITVHEGRYHLIKRMIAACGGSVLALHREAVGALPLPADLGPGEVRAATEHELSCLVEAPPRRDP